ncbi:putative RILP-like protein-like protein [Hypsibius exemplaris]|uniref:RILP-like protein-like protein n=1 Tax=Hypsibius exemplaris TaxID=2072580 RepID=A0A1W0WIX3_HYPEX|nr:putative RILP-like protein-like protein [Hypsibius exemplaris]
MELYVNVVDVYEAASDIGRDLEQLAEKYGADAIDKLVPKVCIVLEQLEQSVVRAERENAFRSELQTATEQMEASLRERKQARLRHEAELGQMEMEWHQEVSELTATMEALIQENEKLRLRAGARRSSKPDDVQVTPSQGGQCSADGSLEDGFMALTASMSSGSVNGYKEIIAKNKEEIRAKTHELEETQQQLSSALTEVEKQAAAIQLQKKRNRNLQNQARKLMEEKNQLTIQVREGMLQIISLEHDMKALQSENGSQGSTATSRSAVAPAVSTDKRSASGADFQEESADAPRFTLNELRNLINERNQLKVKVMELMDELSALKPVPTLSPNSDKISDPLDEIDPDAPVQGPINREPEDKLRPPSRSKPRESSIRSLFRGLFGDSGVVGQGIFYTLKESTAHLADH